MQERQISLLAMSPYTLCSNFIDNKEYYKKEYLLRFLIIRFTYLGPSQLQIWTLVVMHEVFLMSILALC